MPGDLDHRIGKNVAAYRETVGLTQEQLAEKIGVAVETISRLERGVTLPSILRLAEIAEALGIEIDRLLTASSPSKNKKHQELESLRKYLETRTTEEICLIYDLARVVLERK